MPEEKRIKITPEQNIEIMKKIESDVKMVERGYSGFYCVWTKTEMLNAVKDVINSITEPNDKI